MLEENFNFLSHHATTKALTLEEIKATTASDAALQRAMTAIKPGQQGNTG